MSERNTLVTIKRMSWSEPGFRRCTRCEHDFLTEFSINKASPYCPSCVDSVRLRQRAKQHDLGT
jgi:late competence protein required for DNA uptake (superfamily II DNA/RNA helicase)